MANQTLLSLFQNVMQGMGVATYGQPSTVVGNQDQDVVQTLALVNDAMDAMARNYTWQFLRKQYIFAATYYTYTGDTTVDSTSITGMSSIANLDNTFMVVGTGIPQDCFVTDATGSTVTINQAATATGNDVSLTFSKVLFDFPSDYDRQVDRTHWDKSKHWEMLGPSTPQQEEWLRSGWISTGPRVRFWTQMGKFQIWPALGTNESLSYEYLSKWTVIATGDSSPTKQFFSVDTDTSIFPDPLMRALIKLKYFEVKGFDTTALRLAYQEQLDIAQSNDGGNQLLSMNPQQSSVLISWFNIPDSGYGPP